MRTALIVGSSGLIGKQLVELLLLDSYYTTVKAITRSPLSLQHPKLSNVVINFDSLADHHQLLQADDVFCCLGTTIKQAGTKQAFQRVDFDYPLEIAEISKRLGATQYLVVSALGANKDSSIYYNQVKGKLEHALEALNFDALHIFRPSLLLGDRTEQRAGEDAAKIVYKIFGFLIPKKYKAIDSARVARAMLVYAKELKKGVFIHESAEMQHF
jgi:uncharacterized protein YbjT (DUF2867 family)